MSHAPQRALVTGLDGQDGYYLTRHLLGCGVNVIATTHGPKTDAIEPDFGESLPGHLQVMPCDLADAQSVETALIAAQPDVIYHLAAQSSVQVAWTNPVATAQANAMGTLYMLEAIRRHQPEATLVMAGSCDCYDHEAAGAKGVTPDTPLRATNPYAATKIMAQQMVQCYRQEFGLRVSVGILFNHTSPRRHERYLERGLVRNAVRVKLGMAQTVPVGSLTTQRDWSWAPELMEAFAAMGLMEKPVDLILAAGRLLTSQQWVEEIFSQLGLDMDRHMRIDTTRLHKGDRQHTFGNIEATCSQLHWTPRTGLPEMVKSLIEYDMKDLQDNS